MEQRQAEDMSIHILSAEPCKYYMIYKARLNNLTLDGRSDTATVRHGPTFLKFLSNVVYVSECLRLCVFTTTYLMCILKSISVSCVSLPQHDNVFIILMKHVWPYDSIWLPLYSALYLELPLDSITTLYFWSAS